MNIPFVKSPFFTGGRDGARPELIVCHIADGTYAGTIAWFQSQLNTGKVSSHYVVGRKGEITQMVDLADRAHCNGTSTDPKNNMYFGHATHPLVKSRSQNANNYTVSIEFAGFSADNPLITPEQAEAGGELVAHIIGEVKRRFGIDIAPDREHIIGHCEINPVTKPRCPGISFPYAAIIEKAAVLLAPPAEVFLPPEEAMPMQPQKLWRVQVGAFGVKSNAERLAEELKQKGYSAIIV